MFVPGTFIYSKRRTTLCCAKIVSMSFLIPKLSLKFQDKENRTEFRTMILFRSVYLNSKDINKVGCYDCVRND